MGEYHGASTVAQRQEALKRVHDALRSLQTQNQERPRRPSSELQTAVNDLFNQPNLDITADVNIVQPVFDQNLVASGPVYRKGYWSQVTAGPKTGFGLLPSDDGIAFFNSQLLTSYTPITDFQNQIASETQGRKAAKLYEFSATSYDAAQLTIYTVLRTYQPGNLARVTSPQHRRLDLLRPGTGWRVWPAGRRPDRHEPEQRLPGRSMKVPSAPSARESPRRPGKKPRAVRRSASRA